jgi:hypothetical protein
VVSVTNPYGRNLAFLDRSRYFFFQVAPQLYSRGRVDPVSVPLLLRECGSAGNRTRTSGSVAGNSLQLDHRSGQNKKKIMTKLELRFYYYVEFWKRDTNPSPVIYQEGQICHVAVRGHNAAGRAASCGGK